MNASGNSEPSPRASLRLLDVWIEPELDRLTRDGVATHLEPKLTEVLLFLAQHSQHVVSKEQILQAVWPDHFVAESTLSRAIAELRRALGDDAQSPRYIETIPRRGYRLIAPVERPASPGPEASGTSATPEKARDPRQLAFGAAVVLLLGAAMLAVAFRFRSPFVSAGGESETRVIAVAPLKNLSGDPEQDYLAEGMTEALISDLARNRSLRVISRNSVQYYLNADQPLAEIARALKLDGLVAGSVIRDGTRVRVLANLVSTESDGYIWSESYDRDFSDLLTLQGEIAGAIAREVGVRSAADGPAPLEARKPVHPAARDLVLRAEHLLRTRGSDEAGVDEAEKYFESALALQPDYAEALAGLASVHNQRAHIYTVVRMTGDAAQVAAEVAAAEAAALRAVALDPNLARAHVILGDVAEIRHDWAAAKRHNRAALEAAPADPGVNITYGHIHSLPLDERLKYYQRAVELDPASRGANFRLQFHLWQMERLDESRAQGERALALFPDYGPIHFYLGVALIEQGRSEEGLAFVRAQDWTRSPYARLARGPLALALALAGRTGEARATVEAIERDVPEANHADVYAQLGDLDRALAELEQDANGGAGMEYLAWDRLLDPLRDDPRFRLLLRRFDLPELEEIITRARRPATSP